MAERERDEDRGQRIRELIEDQGWQVAHLARTIGVDPSRIYGWLKGERISSENLGALAEALEATRRYIIRGITAPAVDADDAEELPPARGGERRRGKRGGRAASE